MKEYEYSIEIKNMDEVIEYCKRNGYKEISSVWQSRTIFRNKNKTMARITINKGNNTIVKLLDFKEDLLTDNECHERLESLSLEYEDDVVIKSILDFLGYVEDNTIVRNRRIFEKDDLKFELDEYKVPRVTNVVAIEGQKDKVDKEYEKINKFILRV